MLGTFSFPVIGMISPLVNSLATFPVFTIFACLPSPTSCLSVGATICDFVRSPVIASFSKSSIAESSACLCSSARLRYSCGRSSSVNSSKPNATCTSSISSGKNCGRSKISIVSPSENVLPTHSG